MIRINPYISVKSVKETSTPFYKISILPEFNYKKESLFYPNPLYDRYTIHIAWLIFNLDIQFE